MNLAIGSGITAVGAAIANAVGDAIGLQGAITELPITPQRVREILTRLPPVQPFEGAQCDSIPNQWWEFALLIVRCPSKLIYKSIPRVQFFDSPSSFRRVEYVQNPSWSMIFRR